MKMHTKILSARLKALLRMWKDKQQIEKILIKYILQIYILFAKYIFDKELIRGIYINNFLKSVRKRHFSRKI